MNSNGIKKRGNSLPPMRISPLDFRPGDRVKKVSPRGISDVVGVVTHLLPKTFKVRIQWPYGSEVESPEEVYVVNKNQFPATVSFDTSYDSHENRLSEKAYGIGLPKKPKTNDRVASKIAQLFSDKLYDLVEKVRACKAASMSDLETYIKLSGMDIGDEVLKSIIEAEYE